MFQIVYKMVQAQLLQIFHNEMFFLHGSSFLTIILLSVGFFIGACLRKLFPNGPYYVLIYVVSTLLVFMFVTVFQDDGKPVISFEQLIVANVYYGILFAIYLLYRFARERIQS